MKFDIGDIVQHKVTKQKSVIIKRHFAYDDKYLISIGLDNVRLEDGCVLEKVNNESKLN